MKLALLVLVFAGCWRSAPSSSSQPAIVRPAPPPRAARPACDRDGWVLMRAVRECHDIRGGFSGFWVLEIVDGPHAGATVAAYYGEGARSPIGKWNLSKAVTFGTFTPGSQWPNSCLQVIAGTQPMTADAGVNTLEPNAIETFEDEAAARAALADRC